MKLKKSNFTEISLLPDVDWSSTVKEYIVDMLRYDGAFINLEKPGVVAFPMFKTKEGNLYGICTLGRWKSFGVLAIGDPKPNADYESDMHQNPDKWITFRHDNSSDHVQFTFEDYLKVKDMDKLRTETRIRLKIDKCRTCGSPDGKHLGFCKEKL